MNSSRPLFVVGVCTRGRTERLSSLLDAMSCQHFDPSLSFVIVVIDNNDTPAITSAHLGGMAEHSHEIIHQPKPGLVSARNTLLDASERLGADWQIGIDDDVVLAADWLGNFTSLLLETSADVVIGATDYVFPEHTPPIARASKIEQPVIGQPPKRLTTCNYALSRQVFDQKRGIGLRFDPYFNETGGEDVDLFARAKRMHGLVVLGDPRPRVTEPRLGERATLRHRLYLSAQAQVTTYRIKQRHKEIGIAKSALPMWVVVMLRTNHDFIYGLGRILVGLSSLPLRREFGWRQTGLGLLQLARCGGAFAFLKGHVPRLYGQ